MEDRKTLEQTILDGLFERLSSLSDFPAEVLAALQRLRREARLEDPERILNALREGMKEHGRNANSTP